MCLCACAHAPRGRGTAVTGKHKAQNLLNRCNRGIDGSHMKLALEYVEMYQRTEGSLGKKKDRILPCPKNFCS